MSGLLDPENSIKTGVFRRLRPRLFTSVHGVSVVNLWSVRPRRSIDPRNFKSSATNPSMAAAAPLKLSSLDSGRMTDIRLCGVAAEDLIEPQDGCFALLAGNLIDAAAVA